MCDFPFQTWRSSGLECGSKRRVCHWVTTRLVCVPVNNSQSGSVCSCVGNSMTLSCSKKTTTTRPISALTVPTVSQLVTVVLEALFAHVRNNNKLFITPNLHCNLNWFPCLSTPVLLCGCWRKRLASPKINPGVKKVFRHELAPTFSPLILISKKQTNCQNVPLFPLAVFSTRLGNSLEINLGEPVLL